METWYHIDKWRSEIEERECVSSTEHFVTPVPTGMWARSAPRKEAKGNDWYDSRDAAIADLRDRLSKSVKHHRESLVRAEADLKAFELKYGETGKDSQ